MSLRVLLFVVLALLFGDLGFVCQAGTIRGRLVEIHNGAGVASPAEGITVTLYQRVGLKDTKIESIITGDDGLYHFSNLTKGYYKVHVENPSTKEANWGLGAIREVELKDENTEVALDPTVITFDIQSGTGIQ